MQWEEALNSFKAKLASGEDVFTPLINKYILNNQHRCKRVGLAWFVFVGRRGQGNQPFHVRVLRRAGCRAGDC